ncbi:hypothetical protein [Cryobacterium sp. Y57]|uniref:hypothetical protein n=1 Tax=Cryobacterium sp. Y57 TaxID=2048287 RepID=UPI000CE49446|nr:hypothetical protein [Cryobacterium sp. Y57]
MTIEWTPALWSDKLRGTRIKVTRGGNEIVGIYETARPGVYQLLTDDGGRVTLGLPGLWSIFTEKVPPVVLPTIPGWYFDKDGDPCNVVEGETLRAEYAPYTRLRPEAEVAAEVMADLVPKLEKIFYDIGGDRTHSTTRDIYTARRHLGAILNEAKK